MEANVYCRSRRDRGLSLFINVNGQEHYLFTQGFHHSVYEYYRLGKSLDHAMDLTRAHRDPYLQKTMGRIPGYVRYIEKEEDLTIMERTRRKKEKTYESK